MQLADVLFGAKKISRAERMTLSAHSTLCGECGSPSAHSTLCGEHSTRIRLIIINGDHLLKRRLATHQGVAIQFRSRDMAFPSTLWLATTLNAARPK